MSKKNKYRKVLKEIGGKNLLFIDNYVSLNDQINDIMKLVCGKYNKFKGFGLTFGSFFEQLHTFGITDQRD